VLMVPNGTRGKWKLYLKPAKPSSIQLGNFRDKRLKRTQASLPCIVSGRAATKPLVKIAKEGKL
jgi:hypothetical protein